MRRPALSRQRGAIDEPPDQNHDAFHDEIPPRVAIKLKANHRAAAPRWLQAGDVVPEYVGYDKNCDEARSNEVARGGKVCDSGEQREQPNRGERMGKHSRRDAVKSRQTSRRVTPIRKLARDDQSPEWKGGPDSFRAKCEANMTGVHYFRIRLSRPIAIKASPSVATIRRIDSIISIE